MSTKDIQSRAREIKELMRLREELDAEITTLQDEIKAEMTAQRIEEMTAGEYKIRWTTVKSMRLDSKALKSAYADLYSQYSKESVSRRFSIA